MTQTQPDPQADSKAPIMVVQEKEQAPPQQPPEIQPPPTKPGQTIPKPVQILGALALLVGIGFGAYRLFFYHPQPDGLFLSGRIEGYETDVSAKTGGRVAKVAVREGDTVKPGQLLVDIDDSDTKAQLQGAQARLRQQ